MSLVARRALASVVVRPVGAKRIIARPLSLNKNAYLVRRRPRARSDARARQEEWNGLREDTHKTWRITTCAF